MSTFSTFFEAQLWRARIQFSCELRFSLAGRWLTWALCRSPMGMAHGAAGDRVTRRCNVIVFEGRRTMARMIRVPFEQYGIIHGAHTEVSTKKLRFLAQIRYRMISVQRARANERIQVPSFFLCSAIGVFTVYFAQLRMRVVDDDQSANNNTNKLYNNTSHSASLCAFIVSTPIRTPH